MLCGDELRWWGVVRFRHKDPDARLTALEKRLAGLVRLYRPTVLAVEEPSPIRLKTSPHLNAVRSRIRLTGKALGLQVRALDASAVRKRLCGCARARRADLARRIVEDYPHLARRGAPKSRWEKEYWMPMFAAIAAGMACGKSRS